MKSRKQARLVLTVSSFDRIPRWMQKHAYAYFLAPIYCSGAGNQSTVWYILPENKNNFRLKSPKIKNSSASAESYWFL